jgi:NAD(P)-dependent dehydrogenase (short-subunit alcohol dehydrogenase family)
VSGWTTALVTGAGSGIGRALAQALAAEGVRVAVTDRDGAAAERVAGGLEGALGVALDVTDAQAFARAVRDLEQRWGPLDLLVNNAGVGLAGGVVDLSLADWRPVIDVNVWGVIHGVHAVYPRMVERGRGWILNVASGAGLLPRPGMTPYAASKHAIVGLSASLREEAADRGVVVSCACPGYVGTAIQSSTRYVGLDPQALAARIPIQPLSAELCAERLLRGAARGRALIFPNRLTWLEWILYRLSPKLGGAAARWRGRQLRAAETPRLAVGAA